MAESTTDQTSLNIPVSSEPTVPNVISDFKRIYDSECDEDKRRYPGYSNGDPHTNLRVLRQTLRSEWFKEKRLSNGDINTLVNHLFEEPKTSEAFEEWVKQRGYYLLRDTIPSNILKMIAVGQRRVEKTKRSR